MSVGVKAGLLNVTELVLLGYWAPQPLGLIAFWSIQTVHLAIYTAVTWRRTRLPISTLGGVAAVLASVLMLGLHAVGYTWQTIPTAWAVPFFVLAVGAGVSLLLDSRLHRAEWAEWRRHIEGMSLWDTLLMRHIPTLTKRGDL